MAEDRDIEPGPSGAPKAPDVTVGASPAAALMTVGTPRVSMRNYFSTHLLWTANHMAASARAIEAGAGDKPCFDIEHRAYVLSSIIAIAAFLEAAVNELYQDAADGHGVTADGYLAPLAPPTIAALAAAWRGTDRGVKLNVLEKWQLLLALSGKPPLDAGAQPYQDARLVLHLRNALVHYKPEDLSADDEHKNVARLRGKFDDNRLMAGGGNPWWPDHCLGFGCARWAAHSAVALADRVSGELGVRPNYWRVRESGSFGRPVEL